MSGFLDIISGVANAATGGLATQIIDKISEHFPPDMTPEQKAAMQLSMEQLQFEREKATASAAQEAADSLDKRIEMYEGTAKDLAAIPILGAIMLFLRGSQRTIWGFGSLWFDYLWFFTGTSLTQQQQTALIVINTLVLGFLFGERAIKNLMPLLTELIIAKK